MDTIAPPPTGHRLSAGPFGFLVSSPRRRLGLTAVALGALIWGVATLWPDQGVQVTLYEVKQGDTPLLVQGIALAVPASSPRSRRAMAHACRPATA
jgi:hypothetical protein